MAPSLSRKKEEEHTLHLSWKTESRQRLSYPDKTQHFIIGCVCARLCVYVCLLSRFDNSFRCDIMNVD